MNLSKYRFSKTELEDIIKQNEKYFAHIGEEKRESLIDHLLLTQEYFFAFIKAHKLDIVVERLIEGITTNKKMQEFIAEIFVKSIAMHDFGKVNPEFQIKKMNNKIPTFKHSLSSDHSIIGGYIFVLYSEFLAKKMNFSEEYEVFIDKIILALSYPILKHHSSHLDKIKEIEKYNEKKLELEKFILLFKCFSNDKFTSKEFIKEINDYVLETAFIETDEDEIKDTFSLFALVKLAYSLLTSSDYYATFHFTNSWENIKADFGTLDKRLKDKINKNIRISKEYNKKIFESLQSYRLSFPQEKNTTNLNMLRQNLSYEIITGIRKNINKNLFYIEAPTGSGKTNLSLLAVNELLQIDSTINKIFYVFPFTTLITQTFKIVKETLKLENNEIAEIHSKTSFVKKIENEYLDVLNYQFMNYPVSLISHVRFFDILKSNLKKYNYLLHRIANSVVIIDEIQTYPSQEWDKIIFLIKNYSKYFNIKFIIMSATLPKLDKLSEEKMEIVSLIQDKNKYFKNKNFRKRVEFDFSLINRNNSKKIQFKELWDSISEESRLYKSKYRKVHTAVEFIFKRSAREFIDFIKEHENDLFDEIILLSGDILEPRRREIIEKLKSDEYFEKNILLITTQVIESGVDIDMDIGFKDISIIDSDEQFAGRINRNIKKEGSKLFLFDLDDESKIYGKDIRYKMNLSLSEHKMILNEKNFDKLYDLVIEDRREWNTKYGVFNIRNYKKYFKMLDFRSINNECKIIDEKVKYQTLFIPLKVPVYFTISVNNNRIKIPIFNEWQLDYLAKNGKYEGEDKVDGNNVWEIFEEKIKSQNVMSFIELKKEMLMLQGILSQFTISIATLSKNFESLLKSGNLEEKYGFYYLHNPEEIYDYNFGINVSDNELNFW